MRPLHPWCPQDVASAVMLAVVLVLLSPALSGCPKAPEREMARLSPASGPAADEVDKGAGEAALLAEGAPAAPGGGQSLGAQSRDAAMLSAAPAPALDKNAYYSSTYMGGSGDRDRMEKLIKDGVVVDGKSIKLAAFTRQYSQAFEVPTKQALSVSVDTEHGRLPQAGGETHLQIGLQAAKTEAPRRPRVNLVLVIDRSGSMSGEDKMAFAIHAALDVIDGLQPTDTLSIVAYDDRVSVLAPAGPVKDKGSLRQMVQTLSPGGSTNIHDGPKEGYRQAKAGFAGDGVNQVLLLSDGVVTAGVEDINVFGQMASSMADEDIQTTTVGMGMDFDDRLMGEIAQQGRGNYHFIRDAAETREIFQKELGQLTRVVAKAVKLRIVLPDGVELVRVLGSSALSEAQAAATRRTEEKIDQKVYDELGIHRDRAADDEPGIKMLLPHFYAGDSHVVMLKVRVAKGTGERPVAKVEVKYKDLLFRQNREVARQVAIQYTRDKSAVVASTRRAVKKNVLGFQTGEALLQAAELIRRGKVSEAAQVVDEHMALLGVAAQEWNDRDLDRDGQLLSQYQKVIAAAAGGMNPDLGSYLAKSMSYSGYELTR